MNYLNYERTKASVRGAVKVTAEIEGAEMEAALVKAYDNGLKDLSIDQSELVWRFIADVVLKIKAH